MSKRTKIRSSMTSAALVAITMISVQSAFPATDYRVSFGDKTSIVPLDISNANARSMRFAHVEATGTITFDGTGILSGAENFLRLKTSEGSGEWSNIEKSELLGGRLVVTTEDGRTYTIYGMFHGGPGTIVRGRHAPIGVDAELLLSAALEGDLQRIQELVKQGANINDVNLAGLTALFGAAQNGYEDVARFLLEMGAAVDHQEGRGWTPLMNASQEGHEGVVQALLAFGAQADHLSNDNSTALYQASQMGHAGVVQILLDSGASIDQQGADGFTALTIASSKGKSDVVEALLAKGADADHRNNDGATPLSLAAQEGHESIVQILIDAGADTNVHSSSDATPLYVAAKNGHVGVVESLLANGADIDHQLETGYSALMAASQQGHAAIVQTLIEMGAETDYQDKNEGFTSLILASQHGHVGIVKALLIRSLWGYGPLRVDIDHKASNGATALIIASYNDYPRVVELLLENGAEVNVRDNSGRTALTYANSQEVEVVLNAAGAEMGLREESARNKNAFAVGDPSGSEPKTLDASGGIPIFAPVFRYDAATEAIALSGGDLRNTVLKFQDDFQMLSIARADTPSSSSVVVLIAKYSDLYFDNEWVIFPGSSRIVLEGGPFAGVSIECMAGEVPVVGASIELRRKDGSLLAKNECKSEGGATFDLTEISDRLFFVEAIHPGTGVRIRQELVVPIVTASNNGLIAMYKNYVLHFD